MNLNLYLKTDIQKSLLLLVLCVSLPPLCYGQQGSHVVSEGHEKSPLRNFGRDTVITLRTFLSFYPCDGTVYSTSSFTYVNRPIIPRRVLIYLLLKDPTFEVFESCVGTFSTVQRSPSVRGLKPGVSRRKGKRSVRVGRTMSWTRTPVFLSCPVSPTPPHTDR